MLTRQIAEAPYVRSHLRTRLLGFLFVVCLASTSTSASALAGQLQIQFTGVNFVYDGTNLFDAAFPNTVGNGSPAQSDTLTSMSFYLDGIQVGTVLTSNIFADVYLADITDIPINGGVVVSGGNGDTFGFDLLTENNVPGWGLALSVDTMQLFYTGSQIGLAVSGLATSLLQQALPFDLAYDPLQPISIIVASSQLTNVTNDGVYLTGFHAAGTGNVSGVGFIVPEPSAAVLLAISFMAVLGLAARPECRALNHHGLHSERQCSGVPHD